MPDSDTTEPPTCFRCGDVFDLDAARRHGHKCVDGEVTLCPCGELLAFTAGGGLRPSTCDDLAGWTEPQLRALGHAQAAVRAARRVVDIVRRMPKWTPPTPGTFQ